MLGSWDRNPPRPAPTYGEICKENIRLKKIIKLLAERTKMTCFIDQDLAICGKCEPNEGNCSDKILKIFTEKAKALP